MTQKTRGQLSGYDDPKSYWEDRLSAHGDCRGTGHRRFSIDYNIAMYALAANRLERILDTHDIDLRGKTVLDVGAGFGYFINKYSEWGVAHVTGIDLTQTSVEFLSKTYPEFDFLQSDIADETVTLPYDYDAIFAISVLFHIVNENDFSRAFDNICNALKPGGDLIIVDTFTNQLFPMARHTRFRSWNSYQKILERHNLKIITVHPMYYIMSRSIIPFIGPKVLSWTPVLKILKHLDLWLEQHIKSNFGHLKYAILRKQAE